VTEWLDPDNLEDPENTAQDPLNELANESDEIAVHVEFWPVGGLRLGMSETTHHNLYFNLAKSSENLSARIKTKQP
jgi:hypothetical protein